ncbi:MmgE/PrpD family protein [Intrasporangium sp.]|uniref:MmgE/PrpD family protein n=1 Tax=Intrasporangium sp. TaxID=1925024 RepID=UPI002B480B6F|nr:MmgE/PrpD family protein [Intrasporangium sp.]
MPDDGRLDTQTGVAQDRLDRLAAAAARVSYAAVPALVRERVRDLVVDTFAVTAWGSRRDELVALRRVCGHEVPGRSTVLGTQDALPATLAGSLNGAAAAADQLQDGHRTARGHPASHVVLAAFALAEADDCSTESLLSAVIAGYEVGARIGIAMGGTPQGVHDIGTWGAVATAVATTHLLTHADAAAIARAIELAASSLLLSDAHTIFSGYPGGHAYLGASISHGMWLGQAAAAGLAAAPGALERFLAPHAAAHWAGLPPGGLEGSHDYEILRGYLKLHPACAHLHGVLDALDDIRAAEPDADLADQVRAVHVRTYAAASAFDTPARNELEARFSIPTAVALSLLHGRLDDDVLTDKEVASEPVRRLAGRVDVEHAPELDAEYPAGRPTIVEILLTDGRVLTARSTRPRGDADGDASRGAFRAKATRLIHRAFGPSADQLLEVLDEWPDRHTPRQLGHHFRQAAAATAQADA